MRDLWDGLPAVAQDVAVAAALVLPLLLIAALLFRGFAPGPLIRAMMVRFRWPVAVFAVLVAVSVGTGIGLVAQDRALREGTSRAADRFDLIVAAPGSDITMLMATVFLQPTDVGLLDGAAYARVADHDAVAMAAPLAFGDSVAGAPVVGTVADFVTHLSGGAIEGRLWQDHDEAVVGALAPAAIGDRVEPAHGVGEAAEEGAHAGHEIHVVGRMAPTGTPWDRAILVPVESVWEAHGLANGHAPDAEEALGPPFDPAYFPGTPAIMVRAGSLAATYGLRAEFQGADDTMAFLPGAVLARLHGLMGDVRQAMSVLALVAQGLVAVCVLVGLFLLTRLIRRQMALLRALGAPSRFVVAVIWGFSTLILAAGAVLGMAVGLGAAALLSSVIGARTEIRLSAAIGWTELHLVLGFVSLASVAALAGALAAARGGIVDALRG